MTNNGKSCQQCYSKNQVRIRDILVGIRIQILESVPLTNGFECESGRPKNMEHTLVHLHHSSKIKSHIEVTKQQKLRFFLLFLLDDERIRSRIRTFD
jgi:hypothetical protein